MKLIQFAVGLPPRERVGAEHLDRKPLLLIAEIFTEIEGKSRGERQGVGLVFVVVGDAKTGIFGTRHNLGTIKVAKLCDRVGKSSGITSRIMQFVFV